MNSSTPGFSVHGISQARILKWLPFPFPGDLLDPGIEPMSLTHMSYIASRFFTAETPRKTTVDHALATVIVNHVEVSSGSLSFFFPSGSFSAFNTHFLSPKHWLEGLTWSVAFISFTYAGEAHATRVFCNLQAWYITWTLYLLTWQALL